MKIEVLQLREMIEDFVKTYNQEIKEKDKEIMELKNQFKMTEEKYSSSRNESDDQSL